MKIIYVTDKTLFLNTLKETKQDLSLFKLNLNGITFLHS